MRGQQGKHKASILTIAGSDTISGAGIQADIKTAQALGVYATCAVTCLTAQNTTRMTGIQITDPVLIADQIQAVLQDVFPDAIKIGMLPNAATVKVVAQMLDTARDRDVPVIVDPVLSATVGGAMADIDAIELLHSQLFGRAMLVTPNIPELELLAGVEVGTEADLRYAVEIMLRAGPGAVLVKGGHANDPQYVTDRLFVGDESFEFTSLRLPGEFHGTGCMLSAAITCEIAQGAGLVEAVGNAHDFLAEKLQHEVGLGSGSKLIDL